MVDAFEFVDKALLEVSIGNQQRMPIYAVDGLDYLEAFALLTVRVEDLVDIGRPFGEDEVPPFVVLLALCIVVLIHFLPTMEIVREFLQGILQTDEVSIASM